MVSIGATFADLARSALLSNAVTAGFARTSISVAQAAAAAMANPPKPVATTRATNPNAPATASSGVGGIPTPVLIGGAAAVGLVAILFLAKKKKRK